ncbi:tetratricopeptide repeat protein [Streptomyces sp. NPDC047042]|uniref:tetratricopeptide repeat protein n=1 Tax=Streptomyces sp. NPDC047042 TaxID=3154807 RepID=UPI00340D4330
MPGAAEGGGFWGGFWEQSGGTAVWVLGIFALTVVVVTVRLGSGLLLRHQSNRLLPVVVGEDRGLLGGQGAAHRGNGNGHGGADHGPQSARTAELAAYITEHMAADGLGPRVLTPGSGTTTGPDPAPETASSPHGWVDVMKRLAFFQPRAYHVMLHCMSADRTQPRFSVRIMYMPKNIMVAATIMEGEPITRGATNEERRKRDKKLYERIACYCTVKILGDPRSQDRIPRWESWGDDLDSYRFYRMGIRAQERALAAKKRRDPDQERAHYQHALKHYDEAAALVPGNLTVRLQQAGVRELMGQDGDTEEPATHIQRAIEIYEDCVQLWPEHIETAYRLSIACGEQHRYRGQGLHWPADYERDSREHLRLLLKRLSWPVMARRYARTWLPGRRNLGERRYWRQWFAFERPHPSLRSRRRAFLAAVRIAEAADELRMNRQPEPEKLREAFRTVAKEVTGGVWARWGRLWGGPDWGIRRLLHADHRRGGDHAGEGSPAPPAWHRGARTYTHAEALIAGPAPRHRVPTRASTGYLVYYNAACFLSLALSVEPPTGSVTWSGDEWREDCARAAVAHLNSSLRVTRSQFSAAWAERDTDLRPLFTGRLRDDPATDPPRWVRIGRNWAGFAGIHVPD